MYRRGGPGLLTIVYLSIGVFAAGDHNYIHHDTVGQVVSALARDRALAAGRLSSTSTSTSTEAFG